jgi:hypothetical protein
MTATNRPRRRGDLRRGAWRWLAPAALLALAPKCLLCVLAYAGLGAALGLGGPEICGAPAAAPAGWMALPAAGSLGVIGFLAVWRSRRS